MVKSYLRFRHEQSVGLISSGDCPAALDPSGKLALAPALENVAIWNVRQGILVRTLTHPEDQQSISPQAGAAVTCIVLHPDTFSRLVAVGHSDGTVRVWNYDSGVLKVSLKGHRSAVSCLAFDADGSRLVSGARDADLVLWDLISEMGIFRLKGHSGEITQVAFIGRNFIVSSSKDALLKLWDLEQQHCLQTLVGHRLEVWGFAVYGEQLVSGGSDDELRLWDIKKEQHSVVIEARGVLSRNSKHRVLSVTFAEDGTYLIVCAKAKHVDYYRRCSEKECMKKLKRKTKRKKEKGKSKDKDKSTSDDTVQVEEKEDKIEHEWSAEEKFQVQFELQEPLRFESRVKGVSERQGRLLVSLDQNNLEVLDLSSPKKTKLAAYQPRHTLDTYGHRSGMRSLSLRDDCLLSVGGHEARIWNSYTLKGIRSLELGSSVGICGVLLPGNQHCLIGTKNGSIQLYHIPSGELLQEVKGAHKGSVWNIDLHPRGSGFVSGAADKEVKFWRLQLSSVSDESDQMTGDGETDQRTGNEENIKSKTKGIPTLQFVHARTLTMEDDVLYVKYAPDGQSVAVSTVDSQVRLFHSDTLNFRLSFYGHSLPVICFDISSDSSLLVTGSADKTLKVWGMDFGDCHRSFLGHSDAVMRVGFLPGTHYFLSCGKDREVHHWDADKLVRIQSIRGCLSEVWGLAIDVSGSFFLTCENKRALRLWRESDSQVFLEEEQSLELERSMEHDALRDADDLASLNTHQTSSNILSKANGTLGIESDMAAKSTVQSMKGSERLMEMIGIVQQEMCKPPHDTSKNPLLMGSTVEQFLLKALRQIPSSELQLAFVILPYDQALWLLHSLKRFIDQGLDVELCVRCVVFIVNTHYYQLMASHTNLLDELRVATRTRLGEYRDRIGYNKAALQLLQGELGDTKHFYEQTPEDKQSQRPQKKLKN